MTGRELIHAIAKESNCDMLTCLAVAVAIEFAYANFTPEGREFGKEIQERLKELHDDFTALRIAAGPQSHTPSR